MAANEITTTSVVVTGSVVNNGNSEITSKGFCWSETSLMPKIDNDMVFSVGDVKEFTPKKVLSCFSLKNRAKLLTPIFLIYKVSIRNFH
ncbi:MAG: hypothetical protein PHF61_07105 [Bacteroidales bacterium]|nr:hypothetical protein [Bacteroidales bacterium]